MQSVIGADRLSARRLGSAMLAISLGSCAVPSTDDAGTFVEPLEVLPSDVYVLGTAESLAVVQDLEVLPNGTVWVLNSFPPFFVGFGSNGEVIAAHGSRGGGPEEYRLPAGFVAGGWDGEAWVFDVGRHALIRVSTPDAEWAEVGLPREELPPGTVQGGMDLLTPVVRTARLGDEVVLPHSTGSLQQGVFRLIESILKADLMGLDPGTGAVERILTLGDALADPFVGFEATEGGFPLWRRLWAVCSDHLRIYDRVSNQLRGFDRSGVELDPIPLPSTYVTEVTPREFAGAVFGLRQAEVTGVAGNRLNQEDSLRIINEMAQGVTGEPSQLGAYLPRYVDFRCSETGTMWLRPLDIEVGGLGGGRDWIQVSRDGDVRVVTLPERFDALRFTDGRVWGVQRDELDVAWIAWAELPDE